MHKMVIRPYENRDEPEIIALVRELQDHETAFYDRFIPSSEIGSWYVWRALREARASGGELLVAELEGRIVGYATLFARQSSEKFIDEVFYTCAEVGDLVVSEFARRLGGGTALLGECERLARAAGEKWLRITACAANRDAIRLYERHGFAPLSTTMEKPLI